MSSNIISPVISPPIISISPIDQDKDHDQECAICFETLQSDHSVKLQCCNKYIHTHCLFNTLILTSRSCPFCKSQINLQRNTPLQHYQLQLHPYYYTHNPLNTVNTVNINNDNDTNTNLNSNSSPIPNNYNYVPCFIASTIAVCIGINIFILLTGFNIN